MSNNSNTQPLPQNPIPKKENKTYDPKSDGSPDTIRYRNAVNSGEIKKRGRPFMTAAERAKAREKRKEYKKIWNANYKKKRPRRASFVSYEELKQIMRDECITSARQFSEWYRHNLPSRVPEAPDDAYRRRGTWISWNDLFGNNNRPVNEKPAKKIAPYADARAFAMSTGCKSREEWFQYYRKHNPPHMPARPDLIYFKTGDWLSWKEFLGPGSKTFMGRAKDLEINNDKILYIMHVPDPSSNKIFRIGVTVGGWTAIDTAIEKYNIKFVDAYVLDKEFDWNQFISNYGEEVWEVDGIYKIDNIHHLIMDLSQYFNRYKRTS